MLVSVWQKYIFLLLSPASRDLKITRETVDCDGKVEAFLIPVKLCL